MASIASVVDIDDFEFVLSDNLLAEDIENDWCLIDIENGCSTVDESTEDNVLDTPSAVEYDFMTWSDDSECEEPAESTGAEVEITSPVEYDWLIWTDGDSEFEEPVDSSGKEGEITGAVEYDWLTWSDDSECGALEKTEGNLGELSGAPEYDWLIWSDDSDAEVAENTVFESTESVKDLTDGKGIPEWQIEEVEGTHDQLDETDSHGFENIDYDVFCDAELSGQQEFRHDIEEEVFSYFYLDDVISEDNIGCTDSYDDREYILDVYVTERGKMSRKRDHLGNRPRKKYSKKDHGLKKYSWKSTTYDSY